MQIDEITEELRKRSSLQERLNCIRELIEMRVVSLSWVNFKSNWSLNKEEDIGSVEDLSGVLPF